jgi:DNA-binding MurR/RpiR family transcriptional regulator
VRYHDPMAKAVGRGSMSDEPTLSTIRHFSLMNALLGVLNSAPHDSTDCVLARYFLDHFDDLRSLNVYEVANDCFTSRTGIRRFCQSIGLANFSDLKSYAWEWPQHRSLYLGYANHSDFRAHLGGQISGIVASVDASVTDDSLRVLATKIRAAERTVILTSDFSSMAIRQFQQSMLYVREVVHIVTDSTGDVAQLDTLGPQDLLIVISEHGGYAHAVQTVLPNTGVQSALITVDCDQSLARAFGQVIRVANEAPAVGRSVFAQYGVSYLFDLLYNTYYCLFESTK